MNIYKKTNIMPRASPDAATRATAHLKVSMQYKRRGNARKSDAHFGRVLAYGSRSSALAFGVAPAGIEDVREDCSQHTTWTWDKTKIASGRQGTVRIATLAHDRNEYVVKQQLDSYEFKQEAHALIDLQQTTFVPKLHAAWRCEGQGYIVMEKLEPVNLKNGEELERAWSTIGTMLNGIRHRGWMHVDTHGENVMRTTGGRLVFVDFGLGVKKTRDGDGQMYPGHYLTTVLGGSPTWAELATYQEYMDQRNDNPASPGNVCTDPSHNRNARPTQVQVDAYVSAYHQYWKMIGSLRPASKLAAYLYDREGYDDAKEVKYNGSDNEPTSRDKRRRLTLHEPDTDALFPRVGGGFEDALMHLKSELGRCLANVSSLLTHEEEQHDLYPKKAMEACKALIRRKFLSKNFLAPPGSLAWLGNIGGNELGRILSKPVYACLEIKDAPTPIPVGEDGYEHATVKFVDQSKPDVKTQLVYNHTMAGAVTARGLEWSIYDIYLCTGSNVYWRGFGMGSPIAPR